MTVEHVGPGGVSNSYGVRTPTSKVVYENDNTYQDVFIPTGSVPVTATQSGFVDASGLAGIGKAASDVFSLQSDSIHAGSLLGAVDSKILAKADANNWYLLVPKAGTRTTGLLYQLSQGSAVGDAGAGSVGTNYQLLRVAKVIETLRGVACLHTPSGTSGTWSGPTAYSFTGQASGFGIGAWNSTKYYQTTEQNAYKEYSVTVGKAGRFSVGFVVGTGKTGAAKVSIDGVDVDTFSLVASAADVWIKEYSAAPGVHTVRVTKTDANTNPMQVFGANFYDADRFPDGNNLDSLGYARTANYYKNGSTGAIEYAMQGAGTGKFAGSFHGGETRSVFKLLVDGTDVSGAATNSVYAGRDIRIVQETSIDTTVGIVTTQSTTQFLRSGGHVFSAAVDAGTVPLSYFYTHMDVVEAGFNRLVYPVTLDLSGYADNSQIALGPNEMTVLENPTTGQRSATWARQFETKYNTYQGARIWVSTGLYNKPYNGPAVGYNSGAALGKFSWTSVHSYF